MPPTGAPLPPPAPPGPPASLPELPAGVETEGRSALLASIANFSKNNLRKAESSPTQTGTEPASPTPGAASGDNLANALAFLKKQKEATLGNSDSEDESDDEEWD
ncbi:hypothetical protein BJ085DRAFT_34453 [Dimargaris cristalligena]|uniref:WH2 domain-containing protein n=1 Tax=Dimargaris cristalligena TaxID=215637 RepID=A0A4Q0A305_9FUNG|nr:hypothetical protein BJ085DRAFT_34453 [Dimargaris cristalligena]|eukprot:RKP39762.1 hypothetical protein BJ085DRAFT_34453 [Dimargaris cristalligena]